MFSAAIYALLMRLPSLDNFYKPISTQLYVLFKYAKEDSEQIEFSSF